MTNCPTLHPEIVDLVFGFVKGRRTLLVARQCSRAFNGIAKAIVWRRVAYREAVKIFKAGRFAAPPTVAMNAFERRVKELEDESVDDILARCVRELVASTWLVKNAERLSEGKLLIPNLRVLDMQWVSGLAPPHALLPDTLATVKITFDEGPNIEDIRSFLSALPRSAPNLVLVVKQDSEEEYDPSPLEPMYACASSVHLPNIDLEGLWKLSKCERVEGVDVRELAHNPSFVLPDASHAEPFRKLKRVDIDNIPCAAARDVLRLLSSAELVEFRLHFYLEVNERLTGIIGDAGGLRPGALRNFSLTGHAQPGASWAVNVSDFLSLKKFTGLASLVFTSGANVDWLTVEVLRQVLPCMPRLTAFHVDEGGRRWTPRDMSFLVAVNNMAPSLVICGLGLEPGSTWAGAERPTRLRTLDVGLSPLATHPAETAKQLLVAFPRLRRLSHDYNVNLGRGTYELQSSWHQVSDYIRLRTFLRRKSRDALVPHVEWMVEAGMGLQELGAVANWDEDAQRELFRRIAPDGAFPEFVQLEEELRVPRPAREFRPVAVDTLSFLSVAMPRFEFPLDLQNNWRLSWQEMQQPSAVVEQMLTERYSNAVLSQFHRAVVLMGLSRVEIRAA